jgi:hypothetical protein
MSSGIHFGSVISAIIGFGVAIALDWCPPVFAASVISTIDSGGQRVTNANCTMDGSIGGIGGISTNVAPPLETVKAGYIGQLTEVATLSVTGTPSSVNEGNTSQLSGTAKLDDDTFTALPGSEINWTPPSYPLTSISAGGLATASSVYANTNGLFSGYYLGANAYGSLLVLDSLPDNYGSYASDGLPDSWQVGYFGPPPNANAAPGADADGTGQNNLFKYVAGLDPTNPASIFILKIDSVSGQPGQKSLTFSPWASDRTYTPEHRTNLDSGVYTNLTTFTGPTTNSTQITVTDTNATQASKFYRIKITYP